MNKALSGMLIALGAYAYLSIGGIVGAVLFAFGIISIVKLGIPLYTGVAGTDEKFHEKLNILIVNIWGAYFMTLLLYIAAPDALVLKSQEILNNKLDASVFVTFINAIMCGIIVDISVFLSKKENSALPFLIGIPLFIISGFNHSIADVTYITFGFTSDTDFLQVIIYYLIVVFGNYIGCNLRRVSFAVSEK